MSTATADTLREANRLLREIRLQLLPQRRQSGRLVPQELAALFSELLATCESLSLAPAAPAASPALAIELDEYRSNLQELKRLLPAFHVGLLAERSRLESERAHLQAARAWAGTNRKTL